MAKLCMRPGSTSQSVYLFIQDSSVTTGAGLTGLAFNTASLTAYYVRVAGSATSITLATQTATGAFSSGGFVAVDGTNMPGLYRLDIPDAALATGVRSVAIMLKGATNMAPCVLEIDLNAEVNEVAQAGTDLVTGVGALPTGGVIDRGTAQSVTATTIVLRSAAAFTANGDLTGATVYIRSASTGAGQSRVINSYVTSTDTATVDTWATTPTGTIVYEVLATPPASSTLVPNVNVAQISGDSTAADNAESFFDGTGYAGTNNVIPTVTAVTTVNALAANSVNASALATDAVTEIQSGLATASAVSTLQTSINTLDDYVDTEVASIKAKTDFLPSIAPGAAGGLFIAGANAATTANITGDITGNLSGSVGSVTGPVGSVTAQVGISAAAVDAIWDEPKAGHVTAGTYGVYLDSAVSGVSTGGLSLQDIIDGVLDEQIGAHVVSGSVAATISTTNTVAGQIKSKTDNLTFTKAGEVDANMQSINGATITGTEPPFGAS